MTTSALRGKVSYSFTQSVAASDAKPISSETLRAAAREARFTLVGFAEPLPIDGAPLRAWLANGHAADMDWMHKNVEERLDPSLVVPNVRTVMALGIGYRRPANERSRVASYARGRDYHYAHRDRMRKMRKALMDLDPTMRIYACVDTGMAMEKVWAERAGLGWIGKNGLLINRELGSWVTLSVMYFDRAVDVYDKPHEFLCGDCVRCLNGCPTGAFPSPGVVDARLCLSYQSIENRGEVPERLRRGFVGRIFGCDICQDVCPWNRDDIPVGDRRFEPRPLSSLSPAQIAALGEEEFKALSAGMAVARAQYHGLRRNALLTLGAQRDQKSRPVIERLCDDESPIVAEAARWALQRLG
ncbi:MAG: tRNA epoxyqueuosine(34) reductase QueG [Deltaproteobacteria bacterium]|nr:tRNA epoxyqueuosine(34) reductase QueG [Deltaproteobacteria bacterium]